MSSQQRFDFPTRETEQGLRDLTAVLGSDSSYLYLDQIHLPLRTSVFSLEERFRKGIL